MNCIDNRSFSRRTQHDHEETVSVKNAEGVALNLHPEERSQDDARA
jgi:hypothetical protein